MPSGKSFDDCPLNLDDVLMNQTNPDNLELTEEDFEIATCSKLSFDCAHAASMVAWYKSGQT
ncbi:MAG: hypothetical protein J6X48_02980 [Lachnospiraceae bacterium]|nr:hypothetical protein [Lachnospiraceae bacterium]